MLIITPKSLSILSLTTASLALTASMALATDPVSDEVIAEQRAALAAASEGAGFGPQAPRDLAQMEGANDCVFADAPPFTEMNLCNIHFNDGAQDKGGEFTTYLGNGDGEGHGTGFGYAGELTEAELAPIDAPIGDVGHDGFVPGDTIEVHHVYSTADMTPSPTLGSCLSDAISNPQLRVETRSIILVNDDAALDFVDLTAHDVVDGQHQAINIPKDTGMPIQYEGSTTGPDYTKSPLRCRCH